MSAGTVERDKRRVSGRGKVFFLDVFQPDRQEGGWYLRLDTSKCDISCKPQRLANGKQVKNKLRYFLILLSYLSFLRQYFFKIKNNNNCFVVVDIYSLIHLSI